MRRPLTEEEMAREIRRAKRFNTAAFIVTLLLALLAFCGIWYLDTCIQAALAV